METNLINSLNDKSKFYTALFPKWNKSRIIYKGEDAVHEAGILLLPKLKKQDSEMYAAYVERTRFLNAFSRTISGMEGTVKRKDADSNTESIDNLMENIDLSGSTLNDYSDKILHESVKIGFCATLIDYNYISKDNESELTVAEKEKMNLRPKTCFYISDNIYKIEYKNINNINIMALVVLKETYEIKIDEFITETKDQFRVLRINQDNVYEQQIYKVIEEGVDIQEPIIPLVDGKQLSEIPFYIHGKIEEPPLYDLVTNNIKHYQLKADHNHCLHYIGLPTPYRTGVNPNDSELPTSIGPEEIWDLENPNSKVGFLELNAAGLSHITDELEVIKEDMAFLGANMITPDSNINETATKANYRQSSESSNLINIVNNDSISFTKALKMLALWDGKEDKDIYYKYNDDFDVSKFTAQDILARVQSWQAGAFSKQSLYKQLKEGEIELVGETFEEEEDLIGKGE